MNYRDDYYDGRLENPVQRIITLTGVAICAWYFVICAGIASAPLPEEAPPAEPAPPPRPALPEGYAYVTMFGDPAVEYPDPFRSEGGRSVRWSQSWESDADIAAWAWCMAAVPLDLPNTWDGRGRRFRACDDLAAEAP